MDDRKGKGRERAFRGRSVLFLTWYERTMKMEGKGKGMEGIVQGVS